jgi:MFS family permease
VALEQNLPEPTVRAARVTPPPGPARPPSADAIGLGYRWFTAETGSWYGAFGMQGVLFSWILVGELDAESQWVGTAQTSSMLPSLFLLLVGGAIADRFDPRRMLIGLHLLAPIPVLVLAGAAATDALSIPLVIVFALAMGTLTALGNPARDALLARVAGADLMGAIAGMTAVQFACQASGAIAAGLARLLGSPLMLCVHAFVLLSGTLFARGIPARSATERDEAARHHGDPSLRATLRGVREGLSIVLRTAELRGPLLAVFAVGVCFIGPFSVGIPLVIRDLYAGDVDRLAIALTLFPLGTISGSVVLRRTGLRRKGRAMLIALTLAAGLESCLGTGMPFPLFVLAVFAWGLGGAVFINASRTIFQEHAPPAYRGRVLATYQLGFMGGGPIGALAMGFAVPVVGLVGAFGLAGGAMASLVVGMGLASRVPRIP